MAAGLPGGGQSLSLMTGCQKSLPGAPKLVHFAFQMFDSTNAFCNFSQDGPATTFSINSGACQIKPLDDPEMIGTLLQVCFRHLYASPVATPQVLPADSHSVLLPPPLQPGVNSHWGSCHIMCTLYISRQSHPGARTADAFENNCTAVLRKRQTPCQTRHPPRRRSQIASKKNRRQQRKARQRALNQIHAWTLPALSSMLSLHCRPHTCSHLCQMPLCSTMSASVLGSSQQLKARSLPSRTMKARMQKRCAKQLQSARAWLGQQLLTSSRLFTPDHHQHPKQLKTMV